MPAYTKLGLANMLGEGTELDPVLAYMWLDLARSKGDRQAAEAIAKLELDMTPEEVEEGRSLAARRRAEGGGGERF